MVFFKNQCFRQMLAEIGLTIEEFFSDIPKDMLCERLNKADGLTEQEIRGALAEREV